MDQVEASAQRFRVENPHGGELASLNFSPHRYPGEKCHT